MTSTERQVARVRFSIMRMKRALSAHGVVWKQHKRWFGGEIDWRIDADPITAEVCDHKYLTYWRIYVHDKTIYCTDWYPCDGPDPVVASILKASKAVLHIFHQRAADAALALAKDSP